VARKGVAIQATKKDTAGVRTRSAAKGQAEKKLGILLRKTPSLTREKKSTEKSQRGKERKDLPSQYLATDTNLLKSKSSKNSWESKKKHSLPDGTLSTICSAGEPCKVDREKRQDYEALGGMRRGK